MCGYDKVTGKPLDKSYLEKDLPKYLQHDIDALVEGSRMHVTHLDCLVDEVYGSINSAEVDLLISTEQAAYLRTKYLYGEENEDD